MLPKSYLNSYKHFHFECFFSNQRMIVLEYICDSLSSLLQFWTCPNDLSLWDAKINYFTCAFCLHHENLAWTWRSWEVVIRDKEQVIGWILHLGDCQARWSGWERRLINLLVILNSLLMFGWRDGRWAKPAMGRWIEKVVACALITQTWAEEFWRKK